MNGKILGLALLTSVVLSGCVRLYDQPYGYYEYDYYNKYSHHLEPNASPEPMTHIDNLGKPKGRAPRPYSVTPHDQVKYDSLSNRIKNRQKQVGGKTSESTTTAVKSDVQKPIPAGDTTNANSNSTASDSVSSHS